MRSPPTASAAGLASALPAGTGCSRALAAAVAATAQPQHPDAALIDLGRGWQTAQHDWDTLAAKDEGPVYYGNPRDIAGDAITTRERTIAAAAAARPARTLAGLAVKARILAREAECYAADDASIITWAVDTARDSSWLDQAIGSLIADILRLAQENGR